MVLVFSGALASADEFSFTPSVHVGLAFSATLIEDSNRSPVYGIVEGYALNYGGEEGGLKFLGIGATINKETELVLVPASACILWRYCFSSHIGKNHVGMSFTYSFGGPK